MLEEAEAGSCMPLSERDPFFFQGRTGFVEPAELLLVEVWVLRKGHHGSLDLHGLAGGEVADERCGLVVRDANAADAGIDADVQRDALLRFRRHVVERPAELLLDTAHDLARN